MGTQEFFEEVTPLDWLPGRVPGIRRRVSPTFSARMPEEMISLQAELRGPRPPNVHPFRNTNDQSRVCHIRRRFSVLRETSPATFFPMNRGALKPHRKIYEGHGTAHESELAGEILFIDDRLENVEGASQLGWQTICHRSAEESIGKARAADPPRRIRESNFEEVSRGQRQPVIIPRQQPLGQIIERFSAPCRSARPACRNTPAKS